MEKKHPLEQFKFCPKCGSANFLINNFKSKKCADCGFVYYFNPSAAVACFLKNAQGDLLLAVRANDPAKGSYDLPGGFVDMDETGEEAIVRELKEETGLEIRNLKYIFSIPNHYMYSGFLVDTLDLFFEAEVEDFNMAIASDDVKSIRIVHPSEVNEDDFGLESIKKAIVKYKSTL